MPDKTEVLIRLLWRRWSRRSFEEFENHPDEEDLACLAEGRAAEEEQEAIKSHILHCPRCAQALSLSLQLEPPENAPAPEQILARVKEMVAIKSDSVSVLEIILKAKDKALEIINTTGDVLVGQELVPAPVLRSRSIKEFKEHVSILKDFQDIRVEARIEQAGADRFSLSVSIKDKLSQKAVRDLRVTLIREGIELESYISDSGKVVFEHLLLGKYSVEICAVDSKLASMVIVVEA